MVRSTRSIASQHQQLAVGFFSNLSDVECAVTSLRSVGFPLNQITLVASHFRRQDQLAGVNLFDRFDTGLKSVQQATVYQERLTCGEYIVIVDGTEDELNCAASILSPCRIQEWRVYDLATVDDALPAAISREGIAESKHEGSRLTSSAFRLKQKRSPV